MVSLAFGLRMKNRPTYRPRARARCLFPRVSRAQVATYAVAMLCGVGCDSRREAINDQLAPFRDARTRFDLPKTAASHPMRDKLLPVLEAIYPITTPPAVLEQTQASNFAVTPGIDAKVVIKPGLSLDEQVEAVLLGTAQADAWSFRKNADRPFAEYLQKVKRRVGLAERDQILAVYGKLRLLDFFSSGAAQDPIAKLEPDVKSAVVAMQASFAAQRNAIWQAWMDVKLTARREVADDEPFRPILRRLRAAFGFEEPKPLTWEQAFDDKLKPWATALRADEPLFARITGYDELREQEAYATDTHMRFILDSDASVAALKGLERPKGAPFQVAKVDLGGGYADMTFVLPSKGAPSALKRAMLQALIYAHLFHDFRMLSSSGSDFAERDAENRINPATAIVPERYIGLYAQCASKAALDTLIANFRGEHALLSDLSATGSEDARLKQAHRCIVDGAKGDIYVPSKDDKTDTEGAAPGTRLALFQMLARFERPSAKFEPTRTEEDDQMDDVAAKLKALRKQRATN